MYHYFDLKIVENIVKTKLFDTANNYKNETISKSNPFTNIINVGNRCKVFYNNSLQDFIFIETDTDNEYNDLRCFWYKRDNKLNLFNVNRERTYWLDSLLYEERGRNNYTRFLNIDIKISDDGDTIIIKTVEFNNQIFEDKNIKCNVNVYDLSSMSEIINSLCLNDIDNNFIISDGWLSVKFKDKNLVFISDPLYNEDIETNGINGYNRGRVLFSILSNKDNQKTLELKPDKSLLKQKDNEFKTNLMFGHNITLTTDKQHISIGVNDIMLLSVRYNIEELIQLHTELNKEE